MQKLSPRAAFRHDPLGDTRPLKYGGINIEPQGTGLKTRRGPAGSKPTGPLPAPRNANSRSLTSLTGERYKVRQRRLVGHPSAVSELDFDITNWVDLRAEVAPEDLRVLDKHGFSRDGVVGPGTFQQPGNEPFCGLSAYRFPGACHRQGISLDGCVPPDVTIVVNADPLHVSGNF